MTPGTAVRMSAWLKSVLYKQGNSRHAKEFGTCVGIVDGLTDYGSQQGPEVDVRWQPSGLRYAYRPDMLEVVEAPRRYV